MSPRRSRFILAATTLLVLAALAGGAGPVGAGAWPGANGRLVFVRNVAGDRQIVTLNPNGSDLVYGFGSAYTTEYPDASANGHRIAFDRDTPSNSYDIFTASDQLTDYTNITNHPAQDTSPSWSPNGNKIVFTSSRGGNHGLYIMNADGSNVVELRDRESDETQPRWSSTNRIVYVNQQHGFYRIQSIKADGSGLKTLTDEHQDHDPVWSPDGKQVAFYRELSDSPEIMTINADGTHLRRRTNNVVNEFGPAWSPNGKLIAYTREVGASYDIWVMNPDGSNQHAVITSPGNSEEFPTWLPK